MKEEFLMMKEAKRKRHKIWYNENITVLEASNIKFYTSGLIAFMREPNKPKVDFYLSTGRWKFDHNKVYNGGAKSFLKWYKTQKREQ